MSYEEILIETGDGTCPVHVFTPEGEGPWPAIMFYMDGFGIRPVLLDMGRRMAGGGYVVLLPDLFYRVGRYAPIDPRAIFSSDNPGSLLRHVMGSTNNDLAMQDTAAFLAHIDARKDVSGNRIGTVGYCRGGSFALIAAGTYPDRVAAAASFHGGGLATDAADSPHLFAPAMKGRIYVAAADEDPHYPPEMAERLEKALAEADVDHKCETYAGARHGWTMPDFPIYDEPAAERHWRELFALFEATL